MVLLVAVPTSTHWGSFIRSYRAPLKGFGVDIRFRFPLVGVLIIRALLLGSTLRPPDFWKLPLGPAETSACGPQVAAAWPLLCSPCGVLEGGRSKGEG